MPPQDPIASSDPTQHASTGADPTSPDPTSPDPTGPDYPPDFTFAWQHYDENLGPGQRWTTWFSVEALSRGPEPRPDWLVTSAGAIDTELGILKTGKEADVHLIERADPIDPENGVVMAAKRYRSPDHRAFHRSAGYTEGRAMKRSRDQRALKRKSTFGRQVAAAEWAVSEWSALNRFWQLGLPVPYPVQIDGMEILMEWIQIEGASAPRLAQTRPAPDLLDHQFEQLRAALLTMARAGVVHGDLSAYNILARGEDLVIIDLPQIVDLAGNTQALDFLLRDCANICGWFHRLGLARADEQELLAELIAAAW